MPTWPWGQLEGWTPSLLSVSHPSLVYPGDKEELQTFRFLLFLLCQGFMYVRPVLYMSYIPSPCKTCSFSKNINKIMIYIYM